jgi:hypothetical protein
MQRRGFIGGLAGLAAAGVPIGARADLRVSVRVVSAFDYPGVGHSTTPFHINRRGDIAGDFVDPGNVRRGFVRLRDGSFSAPLVAPGDSGSFTRALGINDDRIVTGEFVNVADNTSHGFFLRRSTYRQFDVAGFASTAVFAINDRGSFCGGSDNAVRVGPLFDRAYVSVEGVLTEIVVPGALDTIAFDINNFNQVAGTYRDSSLIRRGFFRGASGRFTFPIEPPGAAGMFLLGLNDRGWMVGRYVDGAGQVHGFLFKRPDRYLPFDYPGAIETSLNGINNDGVIAGRYNGSDGLRHGFIARLEYDDD